jgi:predicted ATPase
MVGLGEASGDDLSRAAGLFALGNAELFFGELRQSRRHIEDAIALARPLWRPGPAAAFLWVNPLVFALSILGLGFALSDDEEPAVAASREAAELANAGGHAFWLLGVQLCAAIGHACAGRVAEAEAEAERCIALGRATGLAVVVTVAEVIRSWAIARGDPGPAELSQLRADLVTCDAEGVRMWRPFRQGLLADACFQAGRWEDAVAAADEGLAQCSASGERLYEAELHRLRGLALAAGGRAEADDAEASLRRAVSVAQSQGATLFLRRATDSLSRLLASATS